jgi:hypothetical protein
MRGVQAAEAIAAMDLTGRAALTLANSTSTPAQAGMGAMIDDRPSL